MTSIMQSFQHAGSNFLNSRAAWATAGAIGGYLVRGTKIGTAIGAATGLVARWGYQRYTKIDLSCVPPEFIPLVQKIENLKSFHLFEVPKGVHFKPCRGILVGSNLEGTEKVFFKWTQGKRAMIRLPLQMQEQVAFMISDRLGLGVVPPTIARALAPKDCIKCINDQIKRTMSRHLFLQGWDVIQEGVIPYDGSNWRVDINNLCKAVFFNIIVGRGDAGRRNTVIDKSGKIKEVDIEYIGKTKTTSWLINRFSNIVLNKEIINDFLNKDISIIEGVFDELSHLLPTYFWNEETCKSDIPNNTKVNVLDNFKRLKQFLIHNKDSQIKVGDLMHSFYTPDFFG